MEKGKTSVGERILQKVKFHKNHIPTLVAAIEAALNDNEVKPIIKKMFNKSLHQGTWMQMVQVLKGLKSKELRELLNTLNDETKMEDVSMVSCVYCGGKLSGQAKKIGDGFAHVFCTPKDHKNEDAETEKQESKKKGKKTPDAKPAAAKKTADKKTSEPKKVAANGNPFKPESKYAFVYDQLHKGITFENLLAKMKDIYGDKTGTKSNVHIYVQTIKKRFEIATDDKGKMTVGK